MSMLRNRTVWLFGLTAVLATGTSGCIIGDRDDDQGFSVGWTQFYIGAEGRAITCDEAGTPTVRLFTQSHATNVLTTDEYPCTAGGGASRTLDPGRYEVKIALFNGQGKEVSNQVGTFNVTRHGLTDLGVIGFPIQSFHISWTLARGASSLACQDVDAASVVLLTRLASEPEVAYTFPCVRGSGSTPAIQLGTYAVGLRLLNSGGAVLWQNNEQMTVPVDDEKRAILPSVVFNLP